MSSREKSPELIESMIAALEEKRSALSKWEDDFLDSIREQFDERQTLSNKQFEKLESIYFEKA